MAAEEESVGSVKHQLSKIFELSLRATVPDEVGVKPLIAACNSGFGDYQCNNAMGLWKLVKAKKGTQQFAGPQPIGLAIMSNLPASEMIESCTVAGPGFVNIKLSCVWIAKAIQKMLTDGIDIWAPRLLFKRVVVDFSSPNIAKNMHVGHLRSTIIGDTLARLLEFSKVEVLRRNHVGDWGTQFGMLIEYLFEKFPSLEVAIDQGIEDLEAFYKASQKRFKEDSEFKKKAQRAVVGLQGGEEKYQKAWATICEISRKNYEKVYQRLGIKLEEKGESFYNPYIPGVLEELDKKGLIEESEGARVIFVEGKKIPLIVVKSDGGFNYDTTDLTALCPKTYVKVRADSYVLCDAHHFLMARHALQVAKRAGWLPVNENLYPKAIHVPFGNVNGEDGKKFRTRSSEVVQLVDLLDEAKSRCEKALGKRGKTDLWTEEELVQTAEAVGYGAVKYADLKNNRSTDYTFNYDQMLSDKGNTAVYLLYAHARICSIMKKSGKDIEELKKTGTVSLGHDAERVLGLRLLQFAEIVEEAISNLLPNVLCEYLYNLAEDFTKFYSACKVVDSAEETSRLLLCEATAVVMRKCFDLLGIVPVYKL